MLYITAFQRMPSSFSEECPLCEQMQVDMKCLVSSQTSYTTVGPALAVRLVFIGKAGGSDSLKLIGE